MVDTDHAHTPRSLQDERLRFEDHRAALIVEHDLINRKVTWLLTSQTILFAALGLAIQATAPRVVQIMAGVGLATCLIIAFGLAGNVIARWKVHVDYTQVVAGLCPAQRRRAWGVRPNGKVEFGVRTVTTVWGVVTDLLVPVVFAGAWVSVLLLVR